MGGQLGVRDLADATGYLPALGVHDFCQPVHAQRKAPLAVLAIVLTPLQGGFSFCA